MEQMQNNILLITKTPQKFIELGLDTLDSLGEINKLTADDLLIINSYKEDEYTAGVKIAELIQKGLKNIMYLTDEPKLNMASLVDSLNGVNDSETFLFDAESLQILIDDYLKNREVYDVAVVGADKLVDKNSIDIIKTFYKDYAQGNKNIKNEGYLALVDNAIKNIAESTTELTNYDLEVKETVNKLYMQASMEIEKLAENKLEIEKRLNEVEIMYNELQGRTNKLTQVQSFASYRHVKQHGTKIILVKEFSQVRYLTSFVLGYMDYLQTVLHKRVRLLTVIPNKDTLLKKYSEVPEGFFHLTGDNYNTEDALNNTIYFTETPISRIYQHLLTLNDDILLVLDRSYNEEEIIKGRVKNWYAFSGKTEADIYPKIKNNKIFSMKGSKNDIIISHIPSYETQRLNRKVQYAKYFNDTYKKMAEENKIELN